MNHFYSLRARYGSVDLILNSWMVGVRWQRENRDFVIFFRVGPLALMLRTPRILPKATL